MSINKKRQRHGWLLVLSLCLAACSHNPLPPSDKEPDPSVAYLRLTQGYWQIWLTDIEGRVHRQLTHNPIDKSRLSWSRQRQQLLATRSDGRVVTIDLQGHITPLPLPMEEVLDAQWSNSGEWLIVSVSSTLTTDNNDLWLVRSNGRDAKKISNHPGVSQLAAWNNDDTQLIYTAGVGAQYQQLWRYTIATAQQEQQTVGKGLKFDPLFTPNDNIMFSANLKGNYDLWLQVPGKPLQQITQHTAYDAQPALAHDGQSLLFYSQRGRQKRIWYKPLNAATTARPITPAAAMSRQAIWLNDQKGTR